MNLKTLYGHLLGGIARVAGVDAAKIFDTLLRDRKLLNLKNPQTLAEKVSYIELHEQSPLAPACTDKYAVRQYVADKGLGDILIPIYGEAYADFDEIDFDSLPDAFVIKATHGCKMNYLVPDKSRLDREECRRTVRKWLKTTYGTYSMEPHYYTIPHRIYMERYLSRAAELIDYKFHCLNGEPRFVLVCSDRKSDGGKAMQVTRDLYDTDWHLIDEIVTMGDEKRGSGAMKKPERFEEMVRIARTLSAEFKFVRVDLYELDGQIYFGELTFTPAHCVFPHISDKFNREMGELLHI